MALKKKMNDAKIEVGKGRRATELFYIKAATGGDSEETRSAHENLFSA